MRPSRQMLAGTTVLLMAALLVPVPPAQAACTSGSFRAGDWANAVSNARGVMGVLKLPAAGEVTGVSSSQASVADVYLINLSDFVQVGWYLGTASQLPTTSTPRMFVGEYYPGQYNGELLRAGPGLSWSSYHTFEISFTSTAGQYQFFLDGIYRFSTQRSHFSQGNAAFNGEVDSTCVRMEARAYRSVTPARTLEYLTYGSQGSYWHYFSDARYASSGFYSVSAGDTATDYSYG